MTNINGKMFFASNGQSFTSLIDDAVKAYVRDFGKIPRVINVERGDDFQLGDKIEYEYDGELYELSVVKCTMNKGCIHVGHLV